MASKTRLQTKFQLKQQERREQIEQRRMLMSQESVTRNLGKSENSYSGGVDISKMFDVADNGRMPPSKTAGNHKLGLQKMINECRKSAVESETVLVSKDAKDPSYPYFGRNGITPPNNGEAYPGEFAGTPSPDTVKATKKNKAANDLAKNRFAAGDSKSNNNRPPLINQVRPRPVVQKKPVPEPRSPRKTEVPKKPALPAVLRSSTKPPNKAPTKLSPKIASKALIKSSSNVSKSPRKVPAKIPKNMAPCKSCNRLFNVFRVERHELICEKTEALRKTRTPYDGSKHRLKGTVVEQFLHAKDGSGDEPGNQGQEGSTNVPVTTSAKPPIQPYPDPLTRLPAGENRPPSARSTTMSKVNPTKKLNEQKSVAARKGASQKKTYEQFIKDMRMQYREALAPPEREPTEI